MSPMVQKLQKVEELPPRIAIRKTGFERFIQELTDHKGDWYLIAHDEKPSFVANLKYNYPDFEFVSRTPEGSKGGNSVANKDVYARWVSSGSQKWTD